MRWLQRSRGRRPRDSVAIVSTAALGRGRPPFLDLDRRSADALTGHPGGTGRHHGLARAGVGRVKSAGWSTTRCRVLLLFTNRPLARRPRPAATLGTIRSFAVENGIQIGIVALSARRAGEPKALSRPLPARRVEYVLTPPNLTDISTSASTCCSPSGRRSTLRAPGAKPGGRPRLSVGAPGVALQPPEFAVTGRPVQWIRCHGGGCSRWAARSGTGLGQARPAERCPSTAWSGAWTARHPNHETNRGRLALGPEQLADGRHDLARASSHRPRCPFLTSTSTSQQTSCAPCVAWSAPGVHRGALVANVVVAVLLLRMGRFASGLPCLHRSAARRSSRRRYPSTARRAVRRARNAALPGPRQAARWPYHPPYMDNQVGEVREFTRLPFRTCAGDETPVKDPAATWAACGASRRPTIATSNSAGRAWRALAPKPQSQISLGRPRTRLMHSGSRTHDFYAWRAECEYVFYQVGLRDNRRPKARSSALGGPPSRHRPRC